MKKEIADYIERFGYRRFNLGCMISLKNKYVYFRVPKVANSTVKLYLNKYESRDAGRKFRMKYAHDLFYGSLLRPHQIGWDSALLEEILTGEEFYKIGFVRNPYSRILSAYLDRYLNHRERLEAGRADSTALLNTIGVKATELGFDEDHQLSFGEFVRVVSEMDEEGIDAHLANQWQELHNPIVKLDHVGYFEFFRRDFRSLLRQIYGDEDQIELKNKSPSKQGASKRLLDYYDAESLKLVTESYRQDFEVYGYSILSEPADLVEENLISSTCTPKKYSPGPAEETPAKEPPPEEQPA